LIETVDLTKAGKTEITVTVEDPDGKQEAITYQFDAANHYVTRQVGAGTKRILVRNVESMDFTCSDSKGSATTNLIDIKKIEVLMKMSKRHAKHRGYFLDEEPFLFFGVVSIVGRLTTTLTP
jgi:hypothetical protein